MRTTLESHYFFLSCRLIFLSPSSPISLSLIYVSFSLKPSLYLSLLRKHGQVVISNLRSLNCHMPKNEAQRVSFGQRPVPWRLILVVARAMWVGKRGFSTLYYHIWPPHFWFKVINKFLLTSSSQWYPLFIMKVSWSSTYFSMQKQQTLLINLSQIEPYFEVTIFCSYSWRTILSKGI